MTRPGSRKTPAAIATPAGESARANMLLIVTDQQTASALSCTGNPYVSTPAMDSLAQRGVRFERAYCTTPLCVPSRMSLMTGRMPREVGAAIHRAPSDDGPRAAMLGRLLADAGYDRGYVGKWHLTVPRTEVAAHGFDQQFHPKDNGVDPLIPEGCEQFLAQPRDRPFFLTAMFLNPHDICEWARGDALPNGDIPPPPSPDRCPPLPANFADAPDEPAVLRAKVQPLCKRVYPSGDWQPEQWRQYLWAYYRMTELVDAQVGRVLAALERSGHADDTVVIFTSDHGDGAAEHRWNQKQALFESCVRVPLIVSGPGVAQGRVDNEHLVSIGLDLLPTVCDYAGAAVPHRLAGRSVRSLVEGNTCGDWRDCVFADTEFCKASGSLGVLGRMARTARHKYVVYSEGEHREQLFDMELDPGETTNLALDPAASGVLDEHRRRLADWTRATGDAFDLAGTL